MSARLLRRGAIADSYTAPSSGIHPVQSASGNTGASAPASFNAAFSGASATGNMLLLAVCSDATVNTPSGWTLDRSEVDQNGLYLYRKTSAGETSVTVTPTVSAASSWVILEYSGAAGSPLNVTTSGHTAFAASVSTGTTGTSSGAANGVAVVVAAVSRFDGSTATVNSYTNSFVEVAESGTTTGSANVTVAVATQTPAGDGTWESTVTINTASYIGALIAVYLAT